MTYDDLLEDFSILESWEEKYKYIMELGSNLETYPSEHKNEGYRVLGCASQVWFFPVVTIKNNEKFFSFKGDSDALIVKGLIRVLAILVNNKSFKELEKINLEDCLKNLGLLEHLSSQRSNGLKSMIQKINEIFSTNQ